MKIDFGAALRDAWALWTRDREILTAIAGMFLFLPTLATLLLIPPLPQGPQRTATPAEFSDWVDRNAQWIVDHGGWVLLASAVSLFGTLTIFTLYLSKEPGDVRAALVQSVALFWRFLLVTLLVTVPASIALFPLILPGVYILGRGLFAAPALVAEPGIGIVAAARRSLAITRGNGLALAALSVIGLFGGQLLAAPFVSIDMAMRAAGAANPIAVMLADIGAAAMASVVALAMVLVRVTIYRRQADGLIKGM